MLSNRKDTSPFTHKSLTHILLYTLFYTPAPSFRVNVRVHKRYAQQCKNPPVRTYILTSVQRTVVACRVPQHLDVIIIFPSVCTAETFPHNCNGPLTSPTRDYHGPNTTPRVPYLVAEQTIPERREKLLPGILVGSSSTRLSIIYYYSRFFHQSDPPFRCVF